MNPDSPNSSIAGLLRELRNDTTTLFRQEVALAKTELKDNASRLGTHALQITIGGLVAYAGVVVLLIGLGQLIGAILMRLGVAEGIATWVAPSLLGLVVAIVGWLMVTRARHALMHDGLAPRQSLASLRTDKRWVQDKLPSS